MLTAARPPTRLGPPLPPGRAHGRHHVLVSIGLGVARGCERPPLSTAHSARRLPGTSCRNGVLWGGASPRGPWASRPRTMACPAWPGRAEAGGSGRFPGRGQGRGTWYAASGRARRRAARCGPVPGDVRSLSSSHPDVVMRRHPGPRPGRTCARRLSTNRRQPPGDGRARGPDTDSIRSDHALPGDQRGFLPDVDHGYVIHSPATVAEHLREYGPASIDGESIALDSASDDRGPSVRDLRQRTSLEVHHGHLVGRLRGRRSQPVGVPRTPRPADRKPTLILGRGTYRPLPDGGHLTPGWGTVSRCGDTLG